MTPTADQLARAAATPRKAMTTTPATQALLPVTCHFCASETRAVTLHAAGLCWAQVECLNDDCSATGPCRDTEAEAIAAWNTRQAHSGDVGRREALAAMDKVISRYTGDRRSDDDIRYALNTAKTAVRAALTPSALSGDAGEGE